MRVDAARVACPVCGRRKFCSVSRDGGLVWCTTVESRDERSYDYGTAWVHVLDGTQRIDRAALQRVALAKDPASIEIRDRVYRALLGALRLERRHRENLRGRGLDDAQIDAGGYASMPENGRGYVARDLEARFGDDLARVPGFFQWESGAWSIAGFSGLLVPVRDVTGAIEGLKVRLDAPVAGGRYRYLSSASKGGAKAVATLHVSLFAEALGAPVIRITEGELKADVTTALSGTPTLSVPGVEAWRYGLQAAQVLAEYGLQTVRVAFDMDRDTNPAVARAQRELVTALRARGLRVGVESWDPAFKGVDDFFSARRAQRTE